MAALTEQEARESAHNGESVPDDRDLYRVIGRLEGRQEMLVNQVRSIDAKLNWLIGSVVIGVILVVASIWLRDIVG